MKVRITTTVDIDPDAWRLAYGLADGDDVRADVKEAAAAWLHQHILSLGLTQENQ